jgi:hypothetical protein
VTITLREKAYLSNHAMQQSFIYMAALQFAALRQYKSIHIRSKQQLRGLWSTSHRECRCVLERKAAQPCLFHAPLFPTTREFVNDTRVPNVLERACCGNLLSSSTAALCSSQCKNPLWPSKTCGRSNGSQRLTRSTQEWLLGTAKLRDLLKGDSCRKNRAKIAE